MASLSEVGQRLKQAREAQGLSLAEVSSRTRITVRHLKALEEGLEADLPEVFYIRGFLKKYAEVVGLSPTDVADFYKPAPVPTAPLPDLRQGSGPLGYYAAIGAFLLLLLGLAWYFQPRVNVVEAPQPSLSPADAGQVEATAAVAVSPDVAATAQVAATPALEAATATPSVVAEAGATAALNASGSPVVEPAATAAASPLASSVAPTEAPSPAASARPDTVSLTLAMKERSWIEVRVGGRLVKEGIASRGEMHRFKGKEIEVSAGNAGGVQVFRNGRELGRLGAHGEVVTRVFKP